MRRDRAGRNSASLSCGYDNGGFMFSGTRSLAQTVLRALLAAFSFALACVLGVAPAAANGLIRDAEIEQTLRIYGEPIFEAAGLKPEDIHIYIISDPSLNAFVAGGQNLFLHTGLLLAADNPNEIIGVMAHETGHIAGGHLARSRAAMHQAMGPAWISIGLGVLAIAAGAPDAGAALIAGSGQMAQANFVRHTQVQESAADQAGMTYLEQTGQTGEGLIDFFNNNLRPYEFATRRIPPYMMTHPYTSDRVESLRRRVEAAPHHNAVDTPDNIRRFQFMQAKLIGFLNTQGQVLSRYPTTDHSQPARYARAVAYYRASDLAQAQGELRSLIQDDPRNAYFQELMGQILFENGRAAESVPFHRRSVQLAPNQPLLIINLARAVIAAQGRDGADESIRLLEQALAIEPDNAFGWRELASARELRGDRALAELASAEQRYATGDFGAAVNFAERARRTLPAGTPAYQRASDIASFAGEEMREQAQRRGRS
jgi:predicted Zn-dependent protease